MLFNSIEYIIFLPIVFILYWLLNRHLKWQNFLVAVVSYIFYGYWDWRFLLLIFFSSLVDFTVGIMMLNASMRKKKILLAISLIANLGTLGFFKYYNFFIDNFVQMMQGLGLSLNFDTLSIILPVGISFYTFQTLSYTIDIYKNQLKPTKDPLAFFSFVSFFPQLVAGPIERAKDLLPQFYIKRKFDINIAKDGLRQILWGLFKKVVVADNAAIGVNFIFENHQELSGWELILGTILFSFQIYGDFSGYSDIAIGSGKLLGFRLSKNFSLPYFSRNIAEFWNRWHISLSSWFRDYVYIPLGGNRTNKFAHLRNILITFIVSGFWHGANWTFIVWGTINGLLFIPLVLKNKHKGYDKIVASHSLIPTLKEVAQLFSTFILVCIIWVYFRAENVSMANDYMLSLVSNILYFDLHLQSILKTVVYALFFIAVLILIEWVQRKKDHGLAIDNIIRPIRWLVYYAGIFCIFYFSKGENNFIYFQF